MYRGKGLDAEIRGTGFLISRSLVITNYHVLGDTDEQVSSAVANLRLRFGALTNLGAKEEAGQVASVTSILEKSPASADDFVLLEADLSGCKGLVPIPLSEGQPSEGSGLHVLHHPGGGPMKLCLSENGLVKVLSDQGKLQYASSTASGSSGSPCLDDDLKVVGIHHAARWKFGGSVGQGILLTAVRQRLNNHL
jgi:V8-like Glu-specific endopeptidase